MVPVVGGVQAFALNEPVVIGSSTGGTQALELEPELTSLPADVPGIAITQHMPEKFNAMYAQRLDGICAMNVREAKGGDRLERGVALIAPGGLHMQLTKSNGQYYVKVVDGPPVNRHKPSVDVLFKSAAECADHHHDRHGRRRRGLFCSLMPWARVLLYPEPWT